MYSPRKECPCAHQVFVYHVLKVVHINMLEFLIACVHSWMHTHGCTHMDAHTWYIHECTQTCTCVSTHTWMYTYMHIHGIHPFMHTHEIHSVHTHEIQCVYTMYVHLPHSHGCSWMYLDATNNLHPILESPHTCSLQQEVSHIHCNRMSTLCVCVIDIREFPNFN